MAKISKVTYKDYSVDADVDTSGQLTVLTDSAAIQNALRIWLESFGGERVRDPGRGGMVTKWLFKPMSEDVREEIEISIRMGVENEFAPFIQIANISVTPNYEKGYWSIKVDAYCPSIRKGVTAIENLRALT